MSNTHSASATPTPSLRPPNDSVVQSTDDGGEVRELSVARVPEGIAVYEFTQGPVTLSAFDVPWREHRVTFAEDDSRYALGFGSRDAFDLTVTFFQGRERHLHELMDALDAALVPYRYDLRLAGQPLVSRVS